MDYRLGQRYHAAQHAHLQANRVHRRGQRLIARQNPADPAPIPQETERMLFGEDFLARKPYDYETAMNFADRPLGYANTEHRVKVPDGYLTIVGLAAKRCVSDGSTEPLDTDEIYKLRHQVPGWRVDGETADTMTLSQTWKLRSFEQCLEMCYRVGIVVKAEGHFPEISLSQKGEEATFTAALGGQGLCLNDFIVAARINLLRTKDLQPERKQKFWA